MKYDFLEQIQSDAVKEEQVVYGEPNEIVETSVKQKSKKKRNISLFNVIVVNLAVCIVIGLTFIALQLWTDVQVSKIGEIIMETFTRTNTY